MKKQTSNIVNIDKNNPMTDLVSDWANFNKDDFKARVEAALVSNGEIPNANYLLVSMLAEQVQTYVKCCADIAKNGLVVDYPNGVSGRNHHVAIRDKSTSLALGILNELCLTPKSLKRTTHTVPAEFEEFMKGPLG